MSVQALLLTVAVGGEASPPNVAAKTARESHAVRSGPMISGGLGLDNGTVGAGVAYEVRLRHRLVLAPWANVLSVKRQPISHGDNFGAAGGLSLAWGVHHRAASRIGAGLVGADELRLDQQIVSSRARPGLVAAAGYEYVGDRGFVFRFLLGGRWLMGGLTDGTVRAAIEPSVSLGWKLW